MQRKPNLDSSIVISAGNASWYEVETDKLFDDYVQAVDIEDILRQCRRSCDGV